LGSSSALALALPEKALPNGLVGRAVWSYFSVKKEETEPFRRSPK